MRAFALLVAVGLALAGAPATAKAADCAGVTVVVDFTVLGGGVRTGCAAGDPASGLAALSGAGFGYRFAARFAGFVCRIDNVPESDPCQNASPATAYWSYWHAEPGGSWTYSDVGAAGHDPAPGTVEGWAFGAGGQPGIAPPAPAPTRPEPSAQPPQPGQPTQPGRTAPPGEPTRPGGPEPTTTPPATTASQSAMTTSPSATTSTSASPTSTTVSATAVAPVAAEQSTGGTFGLIAGIAVIAVLAVLGFRTARRRRRAE